MLKYLLLACLLKISFRPLSAALLRDLDRRKLDFARVQNSSINLIETSKKAQFVEPKERIWRPVSQWYPQTCETILSGYGSDIPRTGENMAKYTAYKDNRKATSVFDDICKRLGWSGEPPENLPSFLDERSKDKVQFSSWTKNDFPWDLPPGAEHWVLWIRGLHTSVDAFHPKRGEEHLLPVGYGDPTRLSVLQDYVEIHNLFGYSGMPESHVNGFKWAKAFHENGKLWKHESTGQTVSRREGERAIRWVGRHTTNFIKERFPEEKYAVLWNRSMPSVRSIPFPLHVHVIIFPKGSNKLKYGEQNIPK